MKNEIERKFLTTSDAWKSPHVRHLPFRQGYIPCRPGVPHATVRVRRAGEQGFLTLKGAARNLVRSEFEYEIPVSDADAMLDELCAKPLIEKNRYFLPAGNGLTWEIDEFLGDNLGLIVAEIELPAADAPFERPAWLGREVTGLSRYYNSSLAERPWRVWTPAEKDGFSV